MGRIRHGFALLVWYSCFMDAIRSSRESCELLSFVARLTFFMTAAILNLTVRRLTNQAALLVIWFRRQKLSLCSF
jgi:hypothetical protein